MPLANISVIIPCYNAAAFIRQAIESALQQTHAPCQVVVVDDGSTDESADIAKSFGERVTLVKKRNQGQSETRNAGIAAARGEYLHFLDADDLLADRAFELLAGAVHGVRDAVGLMGYACFEDDPLNPSEVNLPGNRAFFPDIIAGNLGTPHTWLIPAHIIREIGMFRPGLRIFEDWECWCRVALRGVPLRTVDFPGALYRRHPGSVCENSPRADFLRGHVRVMQTLCEGLLTWKHLPEEHADQLFWSSWTAVHRGRRGGLSWDELKPLATHLEAVSRLQPRTNRFATAIRWLGARPADVLRTFVIGDTHVEGTVPSTRLRPA